MIDRERARQLQELTVRLVFGDHVGLFVFLASLCLFGLIWRTAFLINDSYTIANGLYAVAHGDISIMVAEYGALHSPGTNLYRGDAFSRNYGVIVLSLPFLYALKAISAVADLQIAIVAVWSLLIFATVLLVGRVFDRRRSFTIGGGALVVLLFVSNVALARPLENVQFHLLALQLFHMTVAAFAGVFAYRLVSSTHGRRLGFVAVVFVVLGTPLAFWASVPKRHVVTAAVGLGIALALAKSRDSDDEWAFEARAFAYVLIALLAWVHAPEALVLFVALVVVDVPTAPENDCRTLGTLGLVFLVSLAPLLVTNVLITGDPFTVPRMLRSVSPGADLSLGGGSSGSGGAGGSGSSGETLLPAFALVALSLVESALEPLLKLVDLLMDGVAALIGRPELAFRALVRSGYVDRVAVRGEDAAATNLSLLESVPVLAGLVAVFPALWVGSRRTLRARSLPNVPGPADLFLVLSATMLSLVYISSLPLHAQVTVRYLYPVSPFLVCLLVRLPVVHRAIDSHWRTVLWSTGAGILVGGQLLLVVLVALDVGRGEAFQVHALVALAIAFSLAVWSLVGRRFERGGGIGATLLGLATASAAVFVLFAAIEYFGLGGTHALPMMRVLSELLPLH